MADGLRAAACAAVAAGGAGVHAGGMYIPGTCTPVEERAFVCAHAGLEDPGHAAFGLLGAGSLGCGNY